jgi:hypothetical protein
MLGTGTSGGGEVVAVNLVLASLNVDHHDLPVAIGFESGADILFVQGLTALRDVVG